MSYSDQVKADAKAAAGLLRKHGWIQRQAGNPKIGMCALGACRFATGEPDDYGNVHAARENALANAFRGVTGLTYVADFNDAEGRTKEEVIAVFDKIANS